MSFLDNLFGTQSAANAQEQALWQGLAAATNQIGQGSQDLTSNYTAGLQPYLKLFQQSQGGIGALGNALGLNGPAGSQSALAQLQTSPGYNFAQRQGDNAINAGAAASGMLNSGNQKTALSNYNQNLAQNTYGQYIQSLMPYLGLGTSSAGGIGGLYSGLGNQLNQNQNVLAQDTLNTYGAAGQAQANANLAGPANLMNLIGGIAGLGSSALGSLGGLGGVASLFGGGGGAGIYNV